MAAPVLLFAPGAGAPSSSEWMQGWRARFERLGKVLALDYPYQLAGRRLPDRFSMLLAAHREAFRQIKAEHPNSPVVLVGKSMGGRIGCHVALGEGAAALVCLGYPLVGQNGAVREEVLLDLATPVLFVQGTRDGLCPLERLDGVRQRMKARNALHSVVGGDHSLLLTKTELKRQSKTQDTVDEESFIAITEFLTTTRVG